MLRTLRFATILLLIPLSGCLQQIAVGSLGGIIDDGFQVMNEESDLTIAAESIPGNLKLLETLLRTQPGNTHYLLLASMGYASYTLGFVEDESPARARVLYGRAQEYGLQILRRNSAFARAERGGLDEFTASLASFSSDDVPALFWTGISWGSAISLNLTDPEALAALPKVEAIMKYVLTRDSVYYHGGAHFFLGALAASRPALFGGDPAAARRHFDACNALNRGAFLMPYVYEARTLAVQTQDRELFERCLTIVDTASPAADASLRLPNAIAKKKARLLRAHIDELF